MRTQPPADQTFKALGFLVTKAKAEGDAPSEPEKPVFRLSSEVLDRHRDRVKANSIKTENFNKNPVLLWNHDDCEPAIGTAKVYQQGSEWFMEPTFDGIGTRSQEVAAKVKAGTLRSCSFRFRFLKYAFNEEGGLDYEEVEVLEVSITNVPGNQEALRVKNQNQQQNQTPGTAAKALEQSDVDAISSVLQEALKPVMERLTAIETMCQQMMAGDAEAPEVEAESAKATGEEEGIEVEMSPEEAQEMKAFFGGNTTGVAKS
jgi:HK97 family phage prohead protease